MNSDPGTTMRVVWLKDRLVADVRPMLWTLVGAALLMRSFARLRSVDPGFRPANLLTMRIALPLTRYDTDQKREAFFRELLPRVEELPRGARRGDSAVASDDQRDPHQHFRGAGKDATGSQGAVIFGPVQSITPGYFRTLRIPLKRGREF